MSEEKDFSGLASMQNITNSALQIRLDTTPLLDKIEVFLRGSFFVMGQDQDGKPIKHEIKCGERKANDKGIQSIVNFVSSIINPHVVQGNFDKETYDSYICEVNTDIAVHIVTNCYVWEIDDNDIDVIIDFIMKLVIPFVSRLIDNKERESYISTLKTLETLTSEKKKEGFKLFG